MASPWQGEFVGLACRSAAAISPSPRDSRRLPPPRQSANPRASGAAPLLSVAAEAGRSPGESPRRLPRLSPAHRLRPQSALHIPAPIAGSNRAFGFDRSPARAPANRANSALVRAFPSGGWSAALAATLAAARRAPRRHRPAACRRSTRAAAPFRPPARETPRPRQAGSEVPGERREGVGWRPFANKPKQTVDGFNVTRTDLTKPRR